MNYRKLEILGLQSAFEPSDCTESQTIPRNFDRSNNLSYDNDSLNIRIGSNFVFKSFKNKKEINYS